MNMPFDFPLPERVDVVEVGPRDGLQTENQFLVTEQKAELIRKLVQAGIKELEITSFVHPKWVPQLADAEQLLAVLGTFTEDVRYVALVPNLKGYERALHSGLRKIRMVVIASETFNKKNFNQPISETLESCFRITERCNRDHVVPAAVIGAAFGCPYEGIVPAERTLEIASNLFKCGIQEIVFADTTGIATPRQVHTLLSDVKTTLPNATIGCHFHNTRSTGFSNALAALLAGVERLDSSVGGIGGCPFAPRSSGNIATEDLVHMLHGMRVQTGLHLDRLIRCAEWLEELIGRPLPGQVMKADPVLAR